MEQFLVQWVAPLFYAMLEMSLAGVSIGLVVLLLRKLADKKISPIWKNLFWILVLIALVMPFRPTNDVAVIPSLRVDFAAQREEIVNQTSPIDTQNRVWTEAERQEVEFMTAQETTLQAKSQIFEVALPLLWLLGMAVMGILLYVGHYRIRRSVTACRDHHLSHETTALLERTRQAVSLQVEVQACYQNYLKSPALYGLFQPKILLPEYVGDMTEDSQRYILLHELCHLKHHDLWKNALLLALQVVYWFNPLVWVLFRFVRQDMELLNDERVLQSLETAEQAPYAMSIIEVLGRSNRLPLAPQMLCMVDNKKNTKRRIQMMQLGEVFKKYRLLIAVVCLVIIGVLSALFLTTQPEKSAPEVTNVGDVNDLPGDEVNPLDESSIIGGADGPTEIILRNGAESGMELVDVFVRVNDQNQVQVALGDLYSDTEETLNWESGEDDVLQKINTLGNRDSIVSFINLQNQDWEIMDSIVQSLLPYLPNNTQIRYLEDYASFDPQNDVGDLRIEAFKGLELYVWKGENGTLMYNLLPGTDARKTESAIYNYGGYAIATADIYNIGKLLTAYAEGTYLHVSLMSEDISKEEFEPYSDILTDYLPSNSSMSVGYHDGQFMTEVVDTRQLVKEELEYFNQKYFNADDYDYLANQFLLDEYDTPANVDLAMLFYNGVGVDYAMSVEELDAVTKAYGFEELPTDVTVIPSSAMKQAWNHFVGLPLAEENIRALSSLLYLDKYDCYYHLHGDVNRYGDVTFTRGEAIGNVVKLYYHNTWFSQDFVLRLTQYEDNTYKIYSNLPE